MFGLSQLASLAATIGGPLLAGRFASQSALIVVSSLLSAGGLAGMLVDAGGLAAVWAILIGLGLGAWFSLALTFLILRAHDPAQTAALSGMAQSVGYAIAAVGPPVLGALHDSAGGWAWPLRLCLGVTAGACAFGVLAGRDRVLPAAGGELRPAAR
jgi:CP family cyanate transporter-like MFS transporter